MQHPKIKTITTHSSAVRKKVYNFSHWPEYKITATWLLVNRSYICSHNYNYQQPKKVNSMYNTQATKHHSELYWLVCSSIVDWTWCEDPSMGSYKELTSTVQECQTTIHQLNFVPPKSSYRPGSSKSTRTLLRSQQVTTVTAGKALENPW